SGVEGLYGAAQLMMPNAELGWLKKMKTRLHAAVPPRPEKRPAITSLQLLKLGQDLMDEVRPKLGTKLRLADAVQYRDGLIIALTAFFPLRRRNIAALDLVRHFQQNGDTCTIVIPRAETKTGSPIEFDIPSLVLPYLDEYRILVRPRISPKNECAALWVIPSPADHILAHRRGHQ
ncbi:MAG TPA: hypothetical protein VKA82_10235, partial [Rubrobacter sp.]|nr:hypothetical protein [Rubrobacter sp.]